MYGCVYRLHSYIERKLSERKQLSAIANVFSRDAIIVLTLIHHFCRFLLLCVQLKAVVIILPAILLF